MPVLQVSNACLAYGDVALLDRAELVLEAGEKVALIGRNGEGKSSLMRALAGQQALDDGEVWRQPGAGFAYVAQEPDFALAGSVFDTVAAGLGAQAVTLQAYHHCAQAVAGGDTSRLDELARLQQALEDSGGWTVHHRVEAVLERLRLDGDADVAALSGGGIKRVALARALVSQPEVLLLDEPTNHLDIDGILWLEGLIRDFPGSVVVITHDRAFLDAVATRVLELDRGRLMSFPGNFATYLERKAGWLENEARQATEFDKFLAQEEAWIRKGVEARRTRSAGRVKRLENLRVARAQRRERMGQVRMGVDEGEQSGRLIAELERVTLTYRDQPMSDAPGADLTPRSPTGRDDSASYRTATDQSAKDKTVIRDFSCRLMRGDRVGIIGANGAGKTSLLRLILGLAEPTSGRVRRGTKQEVAYFDQFRTALDPEAQLTDVISPGSEFVEVNGTRKHVIGYLGDFLFSPQRARSPVKSLSGGERNRLLLARLFARPANILVLDEPTNDLDIETLELLEALLADYAGTLFLVSHDRAFLDNVVTQVIAADGDGVWKEYVGGYAEWVKQRPARAGGDAAALQGASRTAGAGGPGKPARLVNNATEAAASMAATGAATAAPSPVPATAAPAAARKAKLSYKETRELEQLPARIEALEAEQAALEARLADPATYQPGAADLAVLTARREAIEAELLACLERWEMLEQAAG
ncbi:MAG: ATP-binding cassette domain-containing protein [Rhodocyclaceae bacterium]|nr:ATP-binding cassette domain-containing protein [Rhodocyclaceae bacterium]